MPMQQLYKPLQRNELSPHFSKFAETVNDPAFTKMLISNPQMQNSLSTADKLVKANAGIFHQKEEGLEDFGIDLDGSPLYSSPELRNESNSFRLGQNQLLATGKVLDAAGAFQSREEADEFAHYSNLAGSPQFMGQLTALIGQGDKEGAVNNILQQFGKGDLKTAANPQDPVSLATAYGAFNVVSNWDRLNNGQRSLALAGLAINGYKYKTGEHLSSRVIAGDKDGPQLTAGGALNLASLGVNVPALLENWDQLDAIQRITGGVGTVSQMVATAKQFGLLNAPQAGSKAVNVTAQQLGSLGFQAAPSVGVGAIVGPASNVPQGYSIVASGIQPNTVIAVPKGHEGSVATMNGTNGVTSLNTAGALAQAGLGAYQVYKNWGKGGAEGLANGIEGGTAVASGLSQLGQVNPYLMGAIVATSALGGVVGKGVASDVLAVGATAATGAAAYQASTQAATQAGAGSAASALGAISAGATGGYGAYTAATNKNLNDQQKGKATRDAVGSAVASYFTFGLSSLAQYADQEFLGGGIQKAVDKTEKYIPGMKQTDKLLGGALSSLGIGTGNKAHLERSAIRERFIDAGLFDKEYNVTLADGSKVYAGFDNNDGQHEFRNPGKAVGEVRKLSAYDVDYTNELDYTANLMTLALTRVLAGGKSTPTDQMAGQLANAALSQVGYHQDLTQETFANVQANARAQFFQLGIKSKEDAYALKNQMFADKRVNEMDLMQVEQGINLAFNEDGFDLAQVLMGGKDKGVSVAHEIKQPAPFYDVRVPQLDPNFMNKFRDRGKGFASIEQNALQDVTQDTLTYRPLPLELNVGSYGGPATAGLFSQALSEYRDPFADTRPTETNTRSMSKEELRALNRQRY